MVYTVFYKTSSFAGYCFLNKNSIHPKRRDVFNFKHFEVTLVKFQICSFIAKNISQAFQIRNNTDYSDFFIVSVQDAQEQYEKAKEFFEMIKAYLQIKINSIQ